MMSNEVEETTKTSVEELSSEENEVKEKEIENESPIDDNEKEEHKDDDDHGSQHKDDDDHGSQCEQGDALEAVEIDKSKEALLISSEKENDKTEENDQVDTMKRRPKKEDVSIIGNNFVRLLSKSFYCDFTYWL